MANGKKPTAAQIKKLRSRQWFDNPDNPDMTALYLERYMNYGLTREELQSRQADHRHRAVGLRPVALQPPPPGAGRARARGHPRGRRHRLRVPGAPDPGDRQAARPPRSTATSPTSAWSRCSTAIRIDGVVLTTGCDKTTPVAADGRGHRRHPGHRAVRRADAQRLVPRRAHRLGHHRLEGARRCMAAGEIDYEEFVELVASSAPSPGHCNTMGTASTMNSLAEALGMSLPGCAAIPAPAQGARRRSPTRPASASSTWCGRTCGPPRS